MTTSYMLELSEDEIVSLWCLLNLLNGMAPLKPSEKAVLRKAKRLMEGR